MNEEKPAISRRGLMLGTGFGALGGLGIGALGATLGPQLLRDISGSAGAAETNPRGSTQAGVARPLTPQQHGLVVVADFDLQNVPATLAALGTEILQLLETPDPTLLPDGAGDLTVLVGLGPEALASMPAGAALADTLEMPLYTGDAALNPKLRGGNLLLYFAASDPGVLDPAALALSSIVPGFTPRWSEYGFRGPGSEGIARNPLGFHDGVIIPREQDELNDDVWIPTGPLAGGTVCVIRRFVLDTAAFQALDLAAQNTVIGRDKITGAPLSGGSLRDEANVTAKDESGNFIMPVNSHVRAAHPSFTGSGLMLRRSFSFAAPNAAGGLDHGLIFTAFQNDIRTFVSTQQRLDEIDALMQFSHPTATAAFAILPGYDENRPLGSTLL